jgi:hypothetical protein
LIYIGEFKNLRVLWDLVSVLPIEIETLPWWHGKLTFQQEDSLTTVQTSRDWEKSRFVTDLGILTMLPGQNDENYIICAGFGYDAQIKIINMLGHYKSLLNLENQMKKRNGSVPAYFVLAFEIKGFDRASTTADLLFFSAIEKDDYLSALTSVQ